MQPTRSPSAPALRSVGVGPASAADAELTAPAGPTPIRRRRRVAPSGIRRLISPLVALAAWQLVSGSGLISAQKLPPPTQVWATAVALVTTSSAAYGTLQGALLVSLERVAIGFAAGSDRANGAVATAHARTQPPAAGWQCVDFDAADLTVKVPDGVRQRRALARPGRALPRRAPAAIAARPGRCGVLVSERLRVNPIKCTAHGMCAELLPEIISLDPWGYPIVPDEPEPDELTGLARKAAASCPTLALLVDKGRR